MRLARDEYREHRVGDRRHWRLLGAITLCQRLKFTMGRADTAVIEWLATVRPGHPGRRLKGRSGRLLTAEKSPRGRAGPVSYLAVMISFEVAA